MDCFANICLSALTLILRFHFLLFLPFVSFSFLWLGYMRGLHNLLRGSVNGDQLSLLDFGKGPSSGLAS